MIKRLFPVLAFLAILALVMPAPVFAAATLSIHGRVMFQGKPLANVTISTVSSGAAVSDVTTNAKGQYLISNLVKGTDYQITPALLTYRFAPTKMTFANLAGNKTQDFTAFAKTRAISGQILPVPTEGLTQVFYTATKFVTADAGGNYTIPAALANVTVHLVPQSLAFRFNPASIDVPPGEADVTGQNFAAIELQPLSGTVTVSGKPVKGVTITAVYTDTTLPTAQTKTDVNGMYSMFVDMSALTPTATHPYFTFSAGTPVTPAAPVTQNWTDATVEVKGNISEGTTGMAGVTVNAGTANGVTSSTGDFDFSVGGSNVPDLFKFQVIPVQVAGFNIVPMARTVSLATGSTGKNFKAIPHSWNVGGKITLNDKGLPGVKVSGGGKTAVTNSAGVYLLKGIPFDTSVALTPFKYGFTFSTIAPFNMPDGNVKNQDFTATRVAAPRMLSGTVVAQGTTTGLKGIIVSLTWNGTQIRMTMTDKNGAYSFKNLIADANLKVTAFAPHFVITPAGAQTVDLTGGDVVQNFSAVRYAPIRGKISGLAKGTVVSYMLNSTTSTLAVGKDGSYAIPVQPMGDYTLSFTLTGFTFNPPSVAFTIKPTTEVIIKNFSAKH